MHNPQSLAESQLRADHSMFRIKICGITRTSDAIAAVNAGADAIGLNFYPGSKRYVSSELARDLANSVGHGVAKVGVFVNCPVVEIAEIAKTAGLNWVQLHGDEPPEILNQIDAQFRILRAYRVRQADLAPVVADLAACRAAGRLPDAILIDSAVPGEYGGTGTKGPGIDVSRDVSKEDDTLYGIPLILAGGLTPENVAEAIRKSCPHGVDVASGVESSPGVKDPIKVNRFVSEARRALGELS